MICTPIKTSDPANLKKILQSIPAEELVEIWIDQLPEKMDAKSILKLSLHSKIIVNKPLSEKGAWKKNEDERISRLCEFIEAGAEYVDIGIDTAPVLLRKLRHKASLHGTRVIVSWHNFKDTPDIRVIKKIIRKAKKYEPQIIKIATFAKKAEDNYTIFKLFEFAKSSDIKLVALCMGEKGIISRIAGLVLGSEINYIALEEKTAPGQLSKNDYNILINILGL